MILVIGYGNFLCGDDAIGPRVAELLADEDIPGVQCVAAHQLTPELAAPVSEADVVLFVDAAVGAVPGQITCSEPVEATSTSFTHHVDPVTLLESAAELYGRRPEAYLYKMTGKDFDLGVSFSPEVAAALPDLLRTIKARISRCTSLALQKG